MSIILKSDLASERNNQTSLLMSLTSKIVRLRNIVRQNGGLKGSLLTLFRTDELKDGTFVGEDYLGNKYYENNNYFLCRNRWVIYGNRFGWDFDGSQVPPEWNRWLRHICDETPIQKPPERKPWMLDHVENTTLDQSKKYIPYSTTKMKIEQWKALKS